MQQALRSTVLMVCGMLGPGCGESDSSAAGGAGGSEHTGPVCEPAYEPLASEEIVTVPERHWPGPLLISRLGSGGDIAYVSLDADGGARLLTVGFDFVWAIVGSWQIDGSSIIVDGDDGELRWPLALDPAIVSVTLDRIDDHHVAAHWTSMGDDDEEVWLAGALCYGCGHVESYPCAFDFDAYWQVVAPDE
jgi:hypothetical protein